MDKDKNETRKQIIRDILVGFIVGLLLAALAAVARNLS